MMTPGLRIRPCIHEPLPALKKRYRVADGSGAERSGRVRAAGPSGGKLKSRTYHMGQPGGEGDSTPRERASNNLPGDALTGPIQVRSERDVLRETFDTFAEGLCVVGLTGALEVANATGGRLWNTTLRDELTAAARQ